MLGKYHNIKTNEEEIFETPDFYFFEPHESKLAKQGVSVKLDKD